MKIESLCAREISHSEINPPHLEAVYLSSSYKFNGLDEGIEIFDQRKAGDVYARYGHPNHRQIAHKLVDLEFGPESENGRALVTNSGMSAINTLITGLCTSGDKMICAHDLYGGSSDLFHLNISRAGIQVDEYDFSDLEGLEKKIEQTSPTILYLESPSNPVLRVYDIKALAEIAKKYDSYLIVDNTFNTSLIQKPIYLGADFVIYSTTKYLNGHGNALGGAILSQHHDLMDDRLLKTMRLNGSTISPMDAWLLGQGIKTLPLRYKAQQHNAQLLADFLNELSQVSKVYYPGLTMHANHDLAKEQMNGFGAMLSFELKENVDRFLRSLRLVTLAPTLGDINSLVLHPATMSHRNMPEKQRLELGITDQLIRLSVGIEHIDDLKSDILEALKA